MGQQGKAAESLKLTPKNMLKNKLIDGIIKEPLGGAHQKPEVVFKNVKDCLNINVKKLHSIGPKEELKKELINFQKWVFSKINIPI